MEFYTAEPTARTSWRLAVLMGANSRTYKFALGDALLQCAGRGQDLVELRELASLYAMSLLRHAQDAPQASEKLQLGPQDYLTIAAAEAEASLRAGVPSERLVDAAARSVPQMVMQKFHNLRGVGELGHRFFELEPSGRTRMVRLSPQLIQIANGEQASNLAAELEARWRIVQLSFSAAVGRSLVSEGLAVDETDLYLTDRRRRRGVAGVAEAMIGFQHGRCLICDQPLTLDEDIAVDHVFPFALMARGVLERWPHLDLDRVWNLAPAHRACNAAKSARPPRSHERQRLAQRNAAIMNSPHPLRRTLEVTLQSCEFAGRADEWVRFVELALLAD